MQLLKSKRKATDQPLAFLIERFCPTGVVCHNLAVRLRASYYLNNVTIIPTTVNREEKHLRFSSSSSVTMTLGKVGASQKDCSVLFYSTYIIHNILINYFVKNDQKKTIQELLTGII